LDNTLVSLTEFLDSIELPVLVMDETRTIRQVNRIAAKTLGKLVVELEGLTLGVAIECLHVGVMGECGVSPYCAGCAFLRNIRDTYFDGQPRYGEYSQHKAVMTDGAKTKQFRFSMTKVGDVVLLMIEEIQELAAAS